MGNKTIKSCPFCGSPAFSYNVGPTLPFPNSESGYVECSHCTAIISADSEEKAIELWNRRAGNG